MNEIERQATRELLLQHPRVSVYVSALSLLGGAWCAYVLDELNGMGGEVAPYTSHPWASLAFGFVLGMPMWLVIKTSLRRDVDYYVWFLCAPLGERLRRGGLGKARRIVGAFALTSLVCLLVAEALEVSSWPAVGGLGAGALVLYPEQRELYGRARERLVQILALSSRGAG